MKKKENSFKKHSLYFYLKDSEELPLLDTFDLLLLNLDDVESNSLRQRSKKQNITKQSFKYFKTFFTNIKSKEPIKNKFLFQFSSNLHWPRVTISPWLTEKAGERWAAMLVCRFSKRWYLGM